MDDNAARQAESRIAALLIAGSGELMNIAFGTALYARLVSLDFIKREKFGNPAFPSEPLTLPGYRGHVAILNRHIPENEFLIGEGGYDAEGS